jgi:hypothetical protein
VALKVRRYSEFPDTIKDRLEYVFIGSFGNGCRGAEEHMVLLDEIAEQNLDHGQWQIDSRGDLSDRGRVLAQA